jgi:hypothetical protein
VLTTKYPYLFVITYGRSGSTLLQGILNTIPGYCIRGENNGVMPMYRRIHEHLCKAHQDFSQIGETPADPWYGIDLFRRDDHLAGLRQLMIDEVLRPPAATRCMGFKEIRYAPLMVGDLGELLAFMREMFPGAGFVFNSRNLDSVLESGWWKNHSNPRDFLEEFERNMKAAFERHAQCSTWVHYDDYIDNPVALEPLFSFLGEPFDLTSIKQTLSVKHSG